MTNLELKLPEEVLENIPSGSREEMVKYLAKFFDTVIDKYEVRFQKRVQGSFGAPLSRFEKSLLKDFLIDQALGKIEETTLVPAETLSA